MDGYVHGMVVCIHSYVEYINMRMSMLRKERCGCVGWKGVDVKGGKVWV